MKCMHESPLMDHFVCNSKYNHHSWSTRESERERERAKMFMCLRLVSWELTLTHTALIEHDDYESSVWPLKIMSVGRFVREIEIPNSQRQNEDIILRHDLITFSGLISYETAMLPQTLNNENVLLRCKSSSSSIGTYTHSRVSRVKQKKAHHSNKRHRTNSVIVLFALQMEWWRHRLY